MDLLTKALEIDEPTMATDDNIKGDLEKVIDDDDRPTEKGKFQNENIYNRLLAYDTTPECKEHFARIKAFLVKSIQLDQETAFEWLTELETFIQIYGLAFSKEDHIFLVRMLYEIITAKNSLNLNHISYGARLFSRLMRKRYILTREELTLDWRPLYETFERILYNENEQLGLLFVPEALETNLSEAITLSRPHFPDSATHEMLDEWRPMLCPSNTAMQRAVAYLNLFLPTTLPPEDHDKGFKLWFDELIHLWLSGKLSGTASESKITILLSRLSSDCMGYIDWKPYISDIFNHFKASLYISSGMSRPRFRLNSDSFDVSPCVQWMVYMISQDNMCLEYISRLFKVTDSFYHPSNTDRRWNAKLQQLLYRLPACYVKRLYRERLKKSIWSRNLPESYKLTDEQTTKFVEILVPVALTSMFNHSGINSATLAFRDLSVLRPEKVVPPLLERLYGSYETLTEPHRLLASINCMAAVIPAMVSPNKHFPEGPSHVVPLLLNSLPGIDSNDMRKCIAVFRLMATLAAHVRMKDYSYLVDERPDLTPEQQQLCLSTAQFEDFVVEFLDKCFVLIENTASATFTNLDQETLYKSGEEGIVEASISSVALSILAQASKEVQMAAVEKVYSHVTRQIFDTKTQGKAIATLCLACAKSSPKETLSKFVPHFSRLIMTLTETNEVFQESLLDDELLFGILLMSEIVRCNSPELLEYKDMIVNVLSRTLKLRSKEGYMLGCAIIRHLIRGLTNISCNDWRNVDLDDKKNQETEERWPFDNWGLTIHVKDLKLRWTQPDQKSYDFVQELLETFMRQSVRDLVNWSEGNQRLTREQVQRSLHIILSCLVGAASLLPSITADPMDLCNVEVPIIPLSIKNSGTKPVNFKDGVNIRTYVVKSMLKVLDFITENCEDDTKSMTLICDIFNTALSYFGYNKTELRLAEQRIKSMKDATQNKLLGSKRHLRYLLVERATQQHRVMLLHKNEFDFTAIHLEILKRFFKLAQSHYVEVRILSQELSHIMLTCYPFVDTLMVPMLVSELTKGELEHNKLKGLLYLAVGRRSYRSLAIEPNWTYLQALWPALIQAPHSSRPSIVRLLDRVCGLVQRSFDTFEITLELPKSLKKLAATAWDTIIDADQYPPPSEEFIEQTKLTVAKRNEQRSRDNEKLILKLVELIEDPHLHWHRRIVAYNLFTHLLRIDRPLPLAAFKLCLSSLISERISIRLRAILLVTAQLKLLKRKHVKRTLRFRESRNSANRESSGDTSQQNDESVTDADDAMKSSNNWMQYKLNGGDYTKEEWNKIVFVDLPHVGFYEWPCDLLVYEPYDKQPKLDRPPEELNDHELAAYNKFMDKDFVAKLVEWFCFEDQKGNENRRFDTKRPHLFKGLFRNFGPCMMKPFVSYVTEYAKSTCEQKQSFVIEFIAGLMRGSKHWSWEMQQDLKKFVIPILDNMTVTQENYNDWTGFCNYVFYRRDVRRFEWLLKYFVLKAISEAESKSPVVTPFIQASRLTLAQFCLIQCDWRAVKNIYPLVVENLKNQDHLLAYANLRTCLASLYSLIYMFDDPSTLTRIPGTLDGGPKRSDFINFLLPRLAILERSKQSSSSSSSSSSHLVVTPDDISSSLNACSNEARQVEPTTSGNGEASLMVDCSKSRYNVASTSNEAMVATDVSLPLGTETANEADMALITETLIKFGQLDTSTDLAPTPSNHHHADHHRHHHGHHRHDAHHHEPQHSHEHLTGGGSTGGSGGSGGGGGGHGQSKVHLKENAAVNSSASRSTGSSSAAFIVDDLRGALPDLNVAAASAVTSGTTALGDPIEESQERKAAIKLMKLTSNWITYNVFRMKSSLTPEFFKLFPLICEMGRDSNDPELAADSLAAVAVLSSSPLKPESIRESFNYVRKIIAEHSWHARVSAAAFIELMISANLFRLWNDEKMHREVEDIVINHLIQDERIEVRESSSLTLSGMIHCEFTKLTPELVNKFIKRASEPLVRRKQANGASIIDPKTTVIRHSGILCLCACVDAFPYTVPECLPDILTHLSDHLTDPQPISTTIKKTMSNFRRTHHDNWQSDKQKFTEDQLSTLADLLVSPSYYA